MTNTETITESRKQDRHKQEKQHKYRQVNMLEHMRKTDMRKCDRQTQVKTYRRRYDKLQTGKNI